MKNILYTVLLTFVFFASCKKGTDGHWDDNIKLSTKAVAFNSSLSSATITTESTSWWLNQISFNGNNVDLGDLDKVSKNFIVTEPDFTVERKEDGKKIVVTMNPNTSNAERTLLISMQSGDYFDGINVKQAK